MRFQSILAATDFSASAEAAVQVAADLARHYEAELVLIHAYNVEVPIASPAMAGGYVLPEGFFEEIGKQARLQVEDAAKKLTEAGVAAMGIAVNLSAAHAIVDEAERRGSDLIVMGTRGLTGLKHVALGSVADRVVRTAPCPVMTVPMPE